MHQQTFAEVTFEHYRKPTRRERFLDELNRVVPWAESVAVIEPVYPKADEPGRPPVGIERMLRLQCLQQWFNLSDPAVEDALYDSRAMQQFVGIDLGRGRFPMRPRSASSVICWKRIRSASSSLHESGRIWPPTGPSWMPPSSAPLVRRRIARRSGIRRCIRRRRGSSGTSA